MNKSKVLVALDYINPDKAKSLVDTLGDLVDWYKVGPMLFTRYGTEIIQYLHLNKKKIFLDLKLHDTPNITSETVTQIAEMGVEYTTIHLSGGARMLDNAAASCRGSKLKLIGVSLLTTSLASDFKEFGFSGSATDLVLQFKNLALESRIAGMLCSPNELASLRKVVPEDFRLVTAGIRIPGREVYNEDQARTASPTEALEAGADFLIIGRPITQSGEPRKRVLELFS